MKAVKEIVALVLFAALLAGFVGAYTQLVTPERKDYGSNWAAFLLEERDSLDVMVFGSSIAYCAVIPAVLYEETGCAPYVLAGPHQTLGQTYYYMREAFKTQSPSLAMVELTGIFYPRYSQYTRVNVGYIPWSVNRLQATFRTAEREEWLGLLFPLYNYHDNFDAPNRNAFHPQSDELAGYTPVSGIYKAGEPEPREVEFESDVYETNLDYIDKIAALCAERDTELIFFLAPTKNRWDAEYLEPFITWMDAREDCVFLDFTKSAEELGLDLDVDFFDLRHVNTTGARVFTAALARYADGHDRKAADPGLWRARVERFEALYH